MFLFMQAYTYYYAQSGWPDAFRPQYITAFRALANINSPFYSISSVIMFVLLTIREDPPCLPLFPLKLSDG